MIDRVGLSQPPIKRITSRLASSQFLKTQLPISRLISTKVNHRIAVCGNYKEGSLRLSHFKPDAMGSTPGMAATEITDWRLELSKVDVWYASYGSNMWKSRLLCYIAGGKVEGMSASCCGARDKTPPKDVVWRTVPHRLLFAGSSHHYWGAGGVAYLHPESDPNEKSHICMYKITLEQFNDILFQENYLFENDTAILQIASPLVNSSDIELLSKNKSLNIEALKSRSYSNIVQLGMEDDVPILTLTCTSSYIDCFKSGEVPLSPPSPKYLNILLKGLVEGKQLTEEAMEYINFAASREL